MGDEMKKRIVGIIAEYNPFHNGHKYQLTYVKNQLNADACIVAMSGNFVQRGIPAIINKHDRAQMAIEEGADIVFEIPTCYATGSLDDFSIGAVALLDSLGMVSEILFGSEAGKIEIISCISEAMLNDKNSFRIIRSAMKSGLSEVEALQTALSLIQDRQLFEACVEAVNQPNNILGILYINAISYLNSKITPITHKRIGQAYLDESRQNMELNNYAASASAIRKYIYNDIRRNSTKISKYIPDRSFKILFETFKKRNPISENDCWELLCEKLLTQTSSLTDFRLVSEDIANGIIKGSKQSGSWQELVDYVSSTGVTPAKVNRCLLHIMLGIKDEMVQECLENEVCGYAKVLAKSSHGESLLKKISSNSKIPILYNGNERELSTRAKIQLHIDQVADSIYEQL